MSPNVEAEWGSEGSEIGLLGAPPCHAHNDMLFTQALTALSKVTEVS